MHSVLPTPRDIFIWAGRTCIICICFLILGVDVHATENDDPTVEKEANTLQTPSDLENDRQKHTPSTTEVNDQSAPTPVLWPPLPPQDQFDWIRLTSGEWLKGELKRLYDRKLEFDSDKLDLQEFDWEDVDSIRSPRVFSVRLIGPITVNGLLEVTKTTVIVTAAGVEKKFNRDQLVTIAPGGEREIDYWSSKISLGFNFSKGNTEQTQYNSTANIKRRTSASRFVFDYFGNISRTRDIETANNHRVQSYVDVFQTQKYYYRLLSAEYFRDPFTNIDHRGTLGCGLGYAFIQKSGIEWDVTGGPAYQTTQFVSVEPGQSSRKDSPAFIGGTHFEMDITQKTDYDFRYNFQILNEDSGTYTHHLVATIGTDLTNWFDFDISVVWDRIQNPTPADDGVTPEQDDFYLILSFGIDV